MVYTSSPTRLPVSDTDDAAHNLVNHTALNKVVSVKVYMFLIRVRK